MCPPHGHISKKSYRRRFCRRLARFVNLSTATPENRSIVKIVSARRTHHIYYLLFLIYYLIKRAALPKAQRNEKTARHSARFYALRAARCADGSRPIPTNIPETDFFYKLVCPPCGHILKKRTTAVFLLQVGAVCQSQHRHPGKTQHR